ncbi:MAG: Asp-tRNA(Asn)/Glu-tRNA(Gln) amidotransferase subunit GatC [Candidatus Gracilibacteria bacterium]
MIDEQAVEHVAKLARIALSKAEVKKFSKDLTGILNYMEILKEVKTDNVPETSQVTGLTNVMEEDKVRSARATREEMLNCSELPKDSDQVRVLPIL